MEALKLGTAGEAADTGRPGWLFAGLKAVL